MQKALGEVAQTAGPGDLVFILLIGHGGSQAGESRFNLPGPDMTAADFAPLLAALSRQQVVFVNTASASGDFVKALSAKGRTIVTATKSAMERNQTEFPSYFVQAFSEEGADADKDQRVSVLEAFTYARREVERFYEKGHLLVTEHAVLDDNGDGTGSATPDPATGDGALARPGVPRRRREHGRRRRRRFRRPARGGAAPAAPRDRGEDRRAQGAQGRDGVRAIRRRAGEAAGGAGAQRSGPAPARGRPMSAPLRAASASPCSPWPPWAAAPSVRCRRRTPRPPCARATMTPRSSCSSARRGRIRAGRAAHRALVRTLAEVGRYADAEEEAKAFQAAKPALARAARHPGRESWPRAAAARKRRPPSRRPSRAAPRTPLAAEVNLASLRLARGERDEAMRGFHRLIDAYNQASSLSSEQLAAVARACWDLGADDPQLFKDALKAFDEAIAADPDNIDARVGLA